MNLLRSHNASIGALTVIGLFFGYDLTLDIFRGELYSLHFWFEALMFGITVAVLLAQVRLVRSLGDGLQKEREKVSRLSGELMARIQQQFGEWKLSRSEQEVGLLLIRGFSMKEIAEIRGVKEKTARHQAASLYAKAGVANRSELASHFIEDLLSEAFQEKAGK
jgi:DNA-binding CsgD family transcriptional regulator